MKNIIVKVTDEDFGLEKKDLNKPVIRYGARGIIVNNEGKIAIFYKRNKNEYKLPGGGIEDKEDAKDAFRREIMEETGCEIDNIKMLGIAIEEKGQTNFQQISYVFKANVTNNTKKLHITKKEQDEGGEVKWYKPRYAYRKVLNSLNSEKGSVYDDKYRSLFMVKRDALIIEYYLNN